MRAKPECEWTADNVTVRDLAQDSAVCLMVDCQVCRRCSQLNVWKIGPRLADIPLRDMRFRCQRCGAYTHRLQVERSCPIGGRHRLVLTIEPKPRFWDEGHEKAHRRAIARAQRRWEAVAKAAEERSGSPQPSRPNVNYRCSDSWL